MEEKEGFERHLRDLDNYCRENSFEVIKSGDGFNSRDSYKNILNIGKEALAFIKEAYDNKSLYLTTQIVLLPNLVQDLSNGQFKVSREHPPSYNWEKSISWLEAKLSSVYGPAENRTQVS